MLTTVRNGALACVYTAVSTILQHRKRRHLRAFDAGKERIVHRLMPHIRERKHFAAIERSNPQYYANHDDEILQQFRWHEFFLFPPHYRGSLGIKRPNNPTLREPYPRDLTDLISSRTRFVTPPKRIAINYLAMLYSGLALLPSFRTPFRTYPAFLFRVLSKDVSKFLAQRNVW